MRRVQLREVKARLSTLVEWMDARSDALFLSTITVAEIRHGIARLERTGAAARATRLGDWLDLVLHLYGDRVIPFDIEAAKVAGPLMDKARATGHSPDFAELAIAATARSRNLTVLTRNLRDFAPLGVRVTNPYEPGSYSLQQTTLKRQPLDNRMH